MKRSLCAIFLIIGMSSCSSRPPVKVFKSSDQARNPYFSVNKKSADQGPFDLYLESRPAFVATQKDPLKPQSLFESWPGVPSFEGLHPLSYQIKDQGELTSQLSKENASSWWVDVLWLEIGANVAAAASSLKLYEPGACIDAYRASLSTHQNVGKPAAAVDKEHPQLSDFTSHETLKDHLGWMCSQVAQVHARTWVPEDVQKLLISFETSVVFRERFRKIATDEAAAIVVAHRMMLQEKTAL